jgi:hypothetical protein
MVALWSGKIEKGWIGIHVINGEYSKVSIFMGNEKCCDPELIRPGDMVTKDRKARVDFG